jgi:hypothetical protein
MNTQTSALNGANAVIALMQQFVSLNQAVTTFMADYNQNNWDTYWQQMATVAVNADGSPGAADGTVNTAHPINLPAGAPILVSRSALINGVSMLQLFQTFMSQAAGTITMPAQANAKTAYLVTG